MQKQILLLLTFALIFAASAVAQNNVERCSTSELHLQKMQNDQQYAQEYMAKRAMMNQIMSARQGPCPDCSTPIILPLYFHFESAMDPCIPDLVTSQVDALSLDYSGNNPDINNFCDIDQDFPSGTLAGDGACMQFCVVGIDYNIAENDPKPNDVINIWVGDIGPGLLGYSPLMGNANGDHITVSECAFGTAAAGCANIGPTAPACGGWQYDLGRTLTHELGHYLGLNHPWEDGGCGFACCGVDDGFADTPTSEEPYYGCPTYPQNSCGSDDLYMLFMDYVDDACMYMFTCDQASFMYNYATTSLQNAINNTGACTTPDPGLVYDGDPCADMPPVGEFSFLPTSACVGEAVTFTDESTFSPNSWSWNFGGGAPNSTDQSPVVSFTSAGTFNVTLTVTNAIGNDTHSETITILAAADPNFDYGGTSFCINDGPLQVATGGNNGGTFTATGGLTIDAATGTIDPTSATAGTTYQINYTTTAGCTVSDSVQITFVGLDDNVITLSAASFCVDNVLEQAMVNTAGGTFSASGGLVIDPNTGAIDLSSGTSGDQYTIYYTTTGNCGNTDSTTISFGGSAIAAFDGLAAGYCIDDAAVTLMANPPGGTFTIDGNPAVDFDPMTLGIGGPYVVEYSVIDGPCVASVSQNIGVGDPDNIDPEISPDLDTLIYICEGESYPLIARGADRYEWDGVGLSCTNCPDPVATPPVPGETYVCTYIDNFGCRKQRATQIFVNPIPDFDLGEDGAIYFGEQYPLNMEQVWAMYGLGTVDTFFWNTVEGINDVSLTTPQAAPSQTTTYVVTTVDTFHVINANGDTIYQTVCEYTDSLTVEYLGCRGYALPTAFTPNNDGKNDRLRIILSSGFESIEEFKVFNRWGMVVFDAVSGFDAWDGTYKGKPQPIGNYVYYVRGNCNGVPEDKRGVITLVR